MHQSTKSSSWRSRGRHGPRWAGACAGLVACVGAASAGAQTVWELTPYRLQIVLGVAPSPTLSSGLEADLRTALVERTDALVGAPWRIAVVAAPPALEHQMIRAIERVTVGSLPRKSLDGDKVILLAVAPAPDGYRLAARELDVRTLLWGTTVSGRVWQVAKLRDAALDVMFSAFRPLGRVERVEGKQVGLRLKALGLPSRDVSPASVGPGDVFLPVIRYNDREGRLRKDKQGNVIYPWPVDWTFLTVESVADKRVQCRLQTGYRTPLSSRRRGRFEQLALAVIPPRKPSVLTLTSRSAAAKPLAGYDVYVRGAESEQAVLLDRTDRRGRISVPPAASPLRILLVRSGRETLARLPVVPGLLPELVAEVANDDRRLEVEGLITGLQEEMVDLVTRREVLFARARARIEAGEFGEAEELLRQLRALPTSAEFALILSAEQRKLHSEDPAAQAKIDAMFQDTQKLVQKYLDKAPIEAIHRELRKARSNAAPQVGQRTD